MKPWRSTRAALLTGPQMDDAAETAVTATKASPYTEGLQAQHLTDIHHVISLIYNHVL